MKIELFQSAGCKSCTNARDALRAAAQGAVPGLAWRDVDVAQEFDYAVELGVMSLPAVAVDGQLAFSSLPTPAQLIAELARRTAGEHGGR